MSGTWDPFMPPAPAAPGVAPAAEQPGPSELEMLARMVFGGPPGQAFLARLRRELEAMPSYLPGMAFDQVAYVEGQKALLRRIDALLKGES